mmetsp:Transcript_90227/g.188667  ORF Transcript_90227/g.188667 Transcript_90227/m.188667 type:complete len:93 (+) Transcript_90227:1997-2275(+)
MPREDIVNEVVGQHLMQLVAKNAVEKARRKGETLHVCLCNIGSGLPVAKSHGFYSDEPTHVQNACCAAEPFVPGNTTAEEQQDLLKLCVAFL